MADDLQVWFESLAIEDAMLNSAVPAVLVSDHDDVINNDVIHDEVESRHDLSVTAQLQSTLTRDKSALADAPSTQPNSVTTTAPPTSGSDDKHGECELLQVEEEVKVHLKEEGSNEVPGLITGNHFDGQQVCWKVVF